MPVADTDIVVYASANMPDTDTGTNGGAIDQLHRMVFTQMSANDTIQAVSSSASDTQNMTVTGRTAAGVIVSETKALTGTTAITFSTLSTVERILKVTMASNAVGTITVRRTTGPVTIQTIPPGERGFIALFIDCASDISGGATRNFYRKVFVRNNHGTLALLNAAIAQSADADARITHLLAASAGDSATATNRITAPSASDTLDPDTFDDNSKAVPGTNLAAGTAIGVWLRLQLPAGDAPHRATYALAINGSTA